MPSGCVTEKALTPSAAAPEKKKDVSIGPAQSGAEGAQPDEAEMKDALGVQGEQDVVLP